MGARLIITDGVDSIDLIADGPGFHLIDWRPQTADYKNDGVWQESSLSSGRHLVDAVYGNVVETLKLHSDHVSQNELHNLHGRLQRLGESAKNYWKNRRGRYVWLEARSADETNSRFAILERLRLVEDPQLYQSPFLSVGGAIGGDMTIILERGHWLAALPGQQAAAAISAQYESLPRGWIASSQLSGDYVMCLVAFGTRQVMAGTHAGNIYLGTWTVASDISWSSVASLAGGPIIYALCVQGDHAVAATSKGVFVSDAAGTSWTVANASMKANSTHSLILGSDGLLYAVGTLTQNYPYYNISGVFRSATGTTWGPLQTQIYSGPNQLTCIYESKERGLMLAGGDGVIYASWDRMVNVVLSRFKTTLLVNLFWEDTSLPVAQRTLVAAGSDYFAGQTLGMILGLQPVNASGQPVVLRGINRPTDLPTITTTLLTTSSWPVLDFISGPNGQLVYCLSTYAGLWVGDLYSGQGHLWTPTYSARAVIYHDGRLIGAGDDATNGYLFDDDRRALILGQEPLTSMVTVVNKATRSTVTRAYRFFNATYTSVMPADLPVNILGLGNGYVQIGDAVYFGAAHTLDESEVIFTNLVFDLSEGLSVGSTVTWEYLSTAQPPYDWKTLTVADQSDGFHLTGVRSVSWLPPADWDEDGVAVGLIGYWVRSRLTAGAGPISVPVQANRQIYTANADYVQLPEHTGQLAALAKVSVYAAGDVPSSPGTLGWFNRALIGLRGLSRGSRFVALLPFGTVWPVTGVEATACSGIGSFVADLQAPAGADALKIVPSKPNIWQDAGVITLTPAIMAEYYGTFRAALRYRVISGADMYLRIKLRSGEGQSEIISNEILVYGDRSMCSLAEFGRIVIPTSTATIQEEITSTLTITLQVFVAPSLLGPVGVPTLYGTHQLVAYDLALLPTDEWAGNIYDRVSTIASSVVAGKHLEIDSATSPLAYLRGVVKNDLGQVTATWLPVGAGELAIERDPDDLGSRLWLLLGRQTYGGTWLQDPTSIPHDVHGLAFMPDRKGWAALAGGNSSECIVMEYDPATGLWSDVADGSYGMWAIAAAGDLDVWAAGDHGVLLHYTGGAWTAATPPGTDNMRCIAMPITMSPETPPAIPPWPVAGADGWAMGEGGVIWRWLNAAWALWRTTTANDIVNLYMRYTRVGMAVGDAGTVLRRNDAWEPMDQVDVSDLKRIVYAAQDGTWWAVGGNGHILRYQYNALSGIWTWKMVAAPTDLVLNDICYLENGSHYNLWAVGGIEPAGTVVGKGVILFYTSLTNVWSVCNDPLPESPLYGVSAGRGNGWLEILAVGRYATLWSTDGTTFGVDTMYGVIYEYGIDVRKLDSDGTKWHAFATGPGCIYYNRNGTWDVANGLTTNYSPIQQRIRDVVILSDTDAYAVADGGAVLRWNGTTWTSLVCNTNFNLESISFDSAGTGWACGVGGVLVKVVGNTCTVMPIIQMTTTASLYGVANLDVGRWRAVGDGGVILDYNDGWRVEVLPTVVATVNMRGCYMPADDEAWVVGENGTILRWLAATWERYASPVSEHLNWVGKIGEDIFIAGANGTWLRWDPLSLRWWELDGPGAMVEVQAMAAGNLSEIWASTEVTNVGGKLYRYSPANWSWPVHLTAGVSVAMNARYLGSRGSN